MDDVDRKIVEILADDARRSLTDIGAAVELSPSAVNERIRRLVANGVIRNFTVEVDHRALGLDVLAFVWVGLRRTRTRKRSAASWPVTLP